MEMMMLRMNAFPFFWLLLYFELVHVLMMGGGAAGASIFDSFQPGGGWELIAVMR